MSYRDQNKEQMRADGLCVEWVADRVFRGTQSRYCGRPVKEDGRCGLHAAAHRRAVLKAAEEKAASEQGRVQEQKARDYCATLSAWGVKAEPAWSSITKAYTGGVEIHPDSMDTLLAVLNGEH